MVIHAISREWDLARKHRTRIESVEYGIHQRHRNEDILWEVQDW